MVREARSDRNDQDASNPWLKALRGDLLNLASIARQCHGWRDVDISAWKYLEPHEFDRGPDYEVILPPAIKAILSVDNQRSLRLDFGEMRMNPHMAAEALLPCLRRTETRMVMLLYTPVMAGRSF